ncbi:MAG: hypothetical protein Kow0092_13330 [Deferrisomatales bacterium]
MRVQVHLTGSLRAILEDRPESVMVDVPGPSTVGELLRAAGIPPRVVVVALVDGVGRDEEYRVEGDAELTLFGPLAGG